MSHQNQGTGSQPPSETPAKRKRGRPRKDENNQAHVSNNVSMPAAPESVKKSRETSSAVPVSVPVPVPVPVQTSTGTADAGNTSGSAANPSVDEMVGQVVTGVVEGTFDSGYLLHVRVGDTDIHLRGLVFLPDRVVPVTPENDIAPNVRMYTRREIPIPPILPVQNPGSQNQVNNNLVPEAENAGRNESRSVSTGAVLKNAEDLEQGKVEQKTDAVMEAVKEPKNHSAPSVDTVMTGPQVEERQAPNPNLKPNELVREEGKGPETEKETNMEVELTKESGPTAAALLEITQHVKDANQGSQVENPQVFNSDLKPNELVLTEETNKNIEATKESGNESAPLLDFLAGPENVSSGPQIGHQGPSSDLKLDGVFHNEVKSLHADEKGTKMEVDANIKSGPGSAPSLDFMPSTENVCDQDTLYQGPGDLKPNEVIEAEVKSLPAVGEETKVEIEATKEGGPASAPFLNFMAPSGILGSGSDFKPDGEVESDPPAAFGNLSLEPNQAPLLAEGAADATVSFEPMGVNMNADLQNPLKKDMIQQEITAGGSNSTPMTSLSLTMFEGGSIQSEPSKLGTEGPDVAFNGKSDFKDSSTPN